MKDHLHDAVEEIKRVDHLIYVSLKYTRTVDVLINVIDRMITTSDCLINALGEHAKQEKKIKSLPPIPMMKCRELKKSYFDDDEIMKFLEFYTLLRALKKADYNSINEYRRHVTLIAMLDEGEYHIHIDKVTEFYKDLRKYLDYIKHLS
ncbi:hypothetical protein COV16_07110 [Candidatus Woesearchaeota archaeon CG10_big_fil_rev_8_21_14_0_10_34_8]|nr:MAG: hypothetical protein COV16_07110 [Candidatus Woesearchaeota archaeon CG10_big_fil_rev_8_21_14_0_10_34_8]